MLDTKEYLDKYPNSTLKDYVNYVESENLRKNLDDAELRINIFEWHKIRDGKYFKISDNNGYTVFQFKCPPLEFFREERSYLKVYNLCICNFMPPLGFSLNLYQSNTIELNKLGCPYIKDCKNTTIKEITRDRYEEIIKFAKENLKNLNKMFIYND